MIPRQRNEPPPRSDRWGSRISKRAFILRAWSWPEVYEVDAVTEPYVNRLLHQAEQTGFTYDGLGAFYVPPYYDAMIERQRERAYQAKQRHRRQEHKRRMARLAELIRTL